jgi:ferredoxin
VQLAGRRLGVPLVRVPYGLDRGLALLKYAVLGIVLYFTYRAGELVFRGFDPCYALISRHGEDITIWAYVVAGLILVGSLSLRIPFCRWLCPLAAVFHPFSRFGLARVKRADEACFGCGACADACPMAIPVATLSEVTSARCTTCLSCVEACPTKDAGVLEWGPPRRFGRRWPQAAAVAIILACLGGAVAATYAVPLPSFTFTRAGYSPPDPAAALELQVDDLTCRGRANLLVWFLERKDMDELAGYLKLEAWPGPAGGRVRIGYDPALVDELAIKRAITEPCYDEDAGFWRPSPFAIGGYDPLAPGDS